MKAIRIHAFGEAAELSHEELPTPVPGTGEVLVRIEAAGVNFIEIYQRRGWYQRPLPFTPGSEGAGVVEAVGEGVTGVRVGDRVASQAFAGSYAEFAVAPADRVVPVPEALATRDAAAAMLQGMTAHYLATSTFPLGPGHRCLIHAAAGGVGLLLCQFARRRGAIVYGTTSTPEKAERAREAGAHEVILYTETDFAHEVRRLTEGKGVSVVYDSVGKTTFHGSLDSLAPRGMLVLFGQASGPVPPVDLQILNQKGSLFVTRPSLNHYLADRRELMQRASDVLGGIAGGTLRLSIGGSWPLEEASAAHAALESRETSGKLLLVP
jgi:NADPH:quinone reductase